VPSHEDWVKVEYVCEFLEVFNRVTNIVSETDNPIVNLFLPEVWRMKDVIGKKSSHKNECIRSMAHKMKIKSDKYWDKCNLLMSVTAILDPRYKMLLIKFCFPIIYEGEELMQILSLLKKV
jgi:3-deoxy-D-arabino-heptulosonate 7-phosphate (DAHP) synthase